MDLVEFGARIGDFLPGLLLLAFGGIFTLYPAVLAALMVRREARVLRRISRTDPGVSQPARWFVEAVRLGALALAAGGLYVLLQTA